MKPSVTQPLGPAWEWMLAVLFRPFDLGRWFVLGFAVFLANLGEGGSGGGGPGNFNFPSGGSGPSPGFGSAIDWVESHIALIVIIVVAGSALILAFSALLIWLGSRGHFITMDSLTRNRPEIQEPWGRLKGVANSLFRWRFALMVSGYVLGLGLFAAAIVVAWSDIAAFTFGRRAIGAILLLVVVLLPVGLCMAFAQMMLQDVIAPAMYVRGWNVTQAWKAFRRDVFPHHLWSLVLYCLMRVLIAIGVAILSVVGCCITCCIATMPYLGTVILLPLFVFPRCYALTFARQFGPDWDVFTTLAPPPAPTSLDVPAPTM